jgi:hypothetical protein
MGTGSTFSYAISFHQPFLHHYGASRFYPDTIVTGSFCKGMTESSYFIPLLFEQTLGRYPKGIGRLGSGCIGPHVMPVREVGNEWKAQLVSRLDVALQNRSDSFLARGGWSSDTLPHCRKDLVTRVYVPLYCVRTFGESRSSVWSSILLQVAPIKIIFEIHTFDARVRHQ